jgi:hypothetical protein
VLDVAVKLALYSANAFSWYSISSRSSAALRASELRAGSMLGMVPHDFTEFLPDDLARDPQALERFRR